MTTDEPQAQVSAARVAHVGRRPPASTSRPTSLAIRLFLFVLVAWGTGGWWWSVATASGRRWAGPAPDEAFAQLRSIERRQTPAAARSMGAFFPQGRMYTYSFYGFAVCNVATSLPPGHPYRTQALRQVERILPVVEELGRDEPFQECQDLDPRGGAIAAGHRNLLRAAYAVLGGARPDILDAFHAESAVLYASFLASPVPFLETYPGLRWPVDNCCALESLRLHDAIFGTDYSETRRRYADWLRAHLDPATQLLPSQVGADGSILDGPRGCALSWSLAFLPALAPDLAREQYERYRSTMFLHPLGTTGIREWPARRDGGMNFDSGPVVNGIGAAASGLGIAAARANHDWDNLCGLLRGLEIAALPVRTVTGEKRYLGEMALLADILALWGKTMRPWDAPPQAVPAEVAPPPDAESDGFWIPLLLIGAFAVLLTALTARDLARAWWRLGPRRHPRTWTRPERIVIALQGALFAAWPVAPGLTWLWTLAVLLALACFAWSLRVPGVAERS